jgi:hypothetical protein
VFNVDSSDKNCRLAHSRKKTTVILDLQLEDDILFFYFNIYINEDNFYINRKQVSSSLGWKAHGSSSFDAVKVTFAGY